MDYIDLIFNLFIIFAIFMSMYYQFKSNNLALDMYLRLQTEVSEQAFQIIMLKRELHQAKREWQNVAETDE